MGNKADQIVFWKTTSSEEIMVLVLGLAALAAVAATAYGLFRWWVARREKRSFYALVDAHQLTKQEEERLQLLARETGLKHPSDLLSQVEIFDSLVERTIRDNIQKGNRENTQQEMDLFYSVREKLFPIERLARRRGSPTATEPATSDEGVRTPE